MQLWRYYLLLTARILYKFRTSTASIIRSTYNCINSHCRDDVYLVKTSDLGRPYWIYIIPTHDMHQWLLELVRNLMAHAKKPHFVFRLNGRVHLNRRGSQFSRLLAAEVCASALVMLDTPRCEVVWEYWVPTPIASFPFTSPPVRHRVPSHSERSILQFRYSWW